MQVSDTCPTDTILYLKCLCFLAYHPNKPLITFQARPFDKKSKPLFLIKINLLNVHGHNLTIVACPTPYLISLQLQLRNIAISTWLFQYHRVYIFIIAPHHIKEACRYRKGLEWEGPKVAFIGSLQIRMGLGIKKKNPQLQLLEFGLAWFVYLFGSRQEENKLSKKSI